MSESMEMPIITAFETRAPREFLPSYTRYYYPAHAELDADERFGGKYAE